MGLITAGPGAALAIAGTSGGKIYAYNNISTAPQQVAPSNPSRQSITFHNPGTVDVLVAPTLATNPVTGAQATLTPSAASRGGCFLVYANGGSVTISGECTIPWQALSVSGADNPLTVMDSNT